MIAAQIHSTMIAPDVAVTWACAWENLVSLDVSQELVLPLGIAAGRRVEIV